MMPPPDSGRITHARTHLFSLRPQFKRLERFAAEGAVIKKTTITEQFSLADFQEMYGEEHILSSGSRRIKALEVAYDKMRTPSPGNTICMP